MESEMCRSKDRFRCISAVQWATNWVQIGLLSWISNSASYCFYFDIFSRWFTFREADQDENEVRRAYTRGVHWGQRVEMM